MDSDFGMKIGNAANKNPGPEVTDHPKQETQTLTLHLLIAVQNRVLDTHRFQRQRSFQAKICRVQAV